MIEKTAFGNRTSRVYAVVAGLVSLSLLASACGSAESTRSAGDADPVTVGALPSLSPAAGFESGGGGLAGGAYTIPGMPGALGPTDQGLDLRVSEQVGVGGTRVKLTAQPGSTSYRFVVAEAGALGDGAVKWDSGEAATNPNCSIPSSNKAPKKALKSLNSVPGSVYCIVPAGTLTTGAGYMVTTTTVKSGASRSERRLFAIADTGDASGSNTLALKSREISAPAASGAVSLGFTTADLGVNPQTNATSGFRGGLPAGWSWVGLPQGMSKAVLGPANGYQDFTEFLTLDTSGTETMLGCKPTSIGKQCQSLTGAAAGVGFAATIATGSDSIVVTQQSDGSNWSFDSKGRLTTYNTPGSAPFELSYRGDGELLKSVSKAGLSWNFYYGGDKQCNDSGRAPGFVDTPDGMICVLEQPFDQWSKFDYTQPQGAAHARLSRLTGAPQSCEFSLGDCDWRDIQFYDIGWDDRNRPFLVRDQIANQSLAAGSLVAGSDPAKDPIIQRTQYDDLGRIKMQELPALTSNGVHQVLTKTYKEFGEVDAKFLPATHQTTTTATMSDGSQSAQLAHQAFDDRIRPLYKLEPNGALTQAVWHPSYKIVYASITGTTVQANEYDKIGMEIGQYSGPDSAFNMTKCSPKSSADVLKDNPCLPTDANAVLSTKTTYGDPASVGNGMIASWFGSSSFAGTPVATSVLNYDGGFSTQVPSGVNGGDWSARITGGLALKREEYSIKIATSDPDIKGSVWLGSSFCAVVDGQTAGSCTYDNSSDNKSATGSPIGFNIDLSRKSDASAAGKNIQITLAPEDGKREPVTNQHFLQRAYTAAKRTTRDPYPNGKDANSGSASFYYENPAAGQATRMEGSSLSGQGASKWTQEAGTSEYEPAPFGATRVKKVTSALGSSSTFEYWGVDETPGDSDLAELGQIPDYLLDAKQLGSLKSITDASGRVSTMISDQYGQVSCTRTSNTSNVNSGNWSCTWRDEMYRQTKAVTAGSDGKPEIETVYTHDLLRTPGDAFTSSTAVTSTEGEPDHTVKQTVNRTQQVETYEDAIGTRSEFVMDPKGNITDEIVTAAPQDGKQAKSITIRNGYNELGYMTSTALGGIVVQRTTWGDAGPGNGMQLKRVEYPDIAMSLQPRYDNNAQLEGQTWTLKSGQKIEESIKTTLGQSLLSTEFAGEKAEYNYQGGTVLKRATIAGVDFNYGYDQDGRRICSAAGIANPGDTPKDCNQLPGHYSYTYANDRVVSTTNPQAAIPDNSWDKNGNYTQIGNMNLQYDATEQLSRATTPDGGILELKRDLSGRVYEQTMNAPTVAPVSLSNAQWKDARALLAKSRKLGTNQNQILDQYVAANVPAIPMPVDEPQRNAGEVEGDSTAPTESGDAQVAVPADPAASATAPTEPEAPVASATEQPDPQAPPTPAIPSGDESVEPAPSESASTDQPAPTEASPAQPAPGADAGPKTQTIKLGYTSPTGSPRVLYSDNDAAIMITLAGGLAIEGGTLTIPSLSGIGKLKIAADGSRGDRAPEFVGPYGEQIGNSDPSTANMPGSRLSTVGVRAFSRDLGTFMQPDPKVAAGAGQYSYGNGDPVNFSDASGTTAMGDWIKNGLTGGHHGMDAVSAGFFAVAWTFVTGALGVAMFKGMMKFNYFAKGGAWASIIVGAMYALEGYGMGFLSEEITTYGHVSMNNSLTWSFNGICATLTGIAGGLGYYFGRASNNLGEALQTVADNAQATLEQGVTALQNVPATITSVGQTVATGLEDASGKVAAVMKQEAIPAIKEAGISIGTSSGKGFAGATVGWGVGGLAGDAFDSYTGLGLKPLFQLAGGAVGGAIGMNFTPTIKAAVSYVRESRLGKGVAAWTRKAMLKGQGVLQQGAVLKTAVMTQISGRGSSVFNYF